MKRKLVSTLEFTSDLVLEYSALSKAVPLGHAKSKMTLYVDDNEDPQTGGIDWEYEFDEDEGQDYDEGSESIGLWFDGKKVTDYDGVMTLPYEASIILREAGYDTTEVDCYDEKGDPI